MIRPAFSIARNTFRECLREPIFVIVHLTSLVLIMLHPNFAWFVFREQEKLVTDASLATTLLFGCVAAVLCASHAISREIDAGTVSLILAKPVNRPLFVLAKFAGVLAVLSLFVWTNGIGTLLALRIAVDQFNVEMVISLLFFGALVVSCLYGAIRNYLHRVSFSATANQALAVVMGALLVVVYFLPEHTGGGYDWSAERVGYPPNLIGALVLVGFAIWAMGALAVALSTRLDMVSNMTVCGVVFLGGLIAEYAHARVSAMRLGDLLLALRFWALGLLPCAVALWLLAWRHLPYRRNPAVRGWMVHLTFGLVALVMTVGLVRDVLGGRYLDEPSQLLVVIAHGFFPLKDGAAAALQAVPNWQLFWMADALAAGKTIPLGYFAYAVGCISMLIGLFYVVGVMLFGAREVGIQTPR